jgi:nucleotide sugar dehydrogenase
VKLAEIESGVARAREDGAEIVLVLGLGFVGTAVAANLARSEKGGRRQFHVIGLDRDDAAGREKVGRLDRGVPPTYADDPSLEAVIAAACRDPRNLVATTDPRAIALADVVVSCINLDVRRASGQTDAVDVPVEGYAAAMRDVGRHLRPDALVVVESTLPVGMCDRVLFPALCEGVREQSHDPERDPPLLAYCYERVMPGPTYLDSVNNFWRAFAGIDARSADRAEAFLSKYVNVAEYPLWRHKTIRAAEMGKLLENSYRATNIAFIEEWARLAEAAGVDLFDVIASIRKRKGTHDNMMLPGLGVGGYCLTKDAMLAAFGARELVGASSPLTFSSLAIVTNERMPLRAVELVERHLGRDLRGRRAVLFGVTYRPEVADTRSSPSETVARALLARGASVAYHDPLAPRWEELPELESIDDPARAVEGADVVIVCLPDARYRAVLPPLLVERLARGALVIDPWNLVAPAVAEDLARHGVVLEVFGRGDLLRAER